MEIVKIECSQAFKGDLAEPKIAVNFCMFAGKPCPDAAPDVQKRQAELRRRLAVGVMGKYASARRRCFFLVFLRSKKAPTGVGAWLVRYV